jgi:hypothetical protein
MGHAADGVQRIPGFAARCCSILTGSRPSLHRDNALLDASGAALQKFGGLPYLARCLIPSMIGTAA